MSASPPTARDAAGKIVRVLHDAGHVAYFAGGCVRDELLGLQPQDYDVATDARPERVRELFHNSRFVGEAFGVVLVRLMSQEIEVATFRTEWGYEDGRRPTKVAFTDAEHDARRRDFTINGLFENPLATDPEQRIIDFVGGREDLQRKLLRAIGDPDERFGEDYLRMLRAPRLAARLGFAIEERTRRAIHFHAKQLGQISRERIGQEVQLMLAHPSRATAAQLIQELHLDGPTLNEEHLPVELVTLQTLTAGASYPAALAAWLLDRHFLRLHAQAGPLAPALEPFISHQVDPILRRWRKALCLSNEQRDDLRAIFLLMPRALAWPTLGVAPRKRLLASPGWPETLAVLHALAGRLVLADLLHRLEVESQPLIAQGVAPPPLLTGDDLLAQGRNPGPEFRRLLTQAYDAQLEGRLASRPEALEWLKQQP